MGGALYAMGGRQTATDAGGVAKEAKGFVVEGKASTKVIRGPGILFIREKPLDPQTGEEMPEVMLKREELGPVRKIMKSDTVWDALNKAYDEL